MSNRLADAAKWLSAEFAATPDEFRVEHREGGDMLLTALLSHRYAQLKAGLLSLTDAGIRFVQAHHPVTP